MDGTAFAGMENNDVFVKLKVYEALNGQQQSKVAKKEYHKVIRKTACEGSTESH